MKIRCVKAKGFKRLAFSNINEIVWTPSTELQIILGTNGSGKSSLLSIAWPHVPKTSEWESDGSFYLELEHGGSHYRIGTVFSPKPTHSFYKDTDENLNPGGTSTVQKQLIETEFRIDTEIHAVLTGRVRFTDMSPSKRKEWMGKLSPMDLKWLTQMYTDTQQSVRASQQNITFINKKILDSAERLHALANQPNIESHYSNLQDLLKQLYELKSTDRLWIDLENDINKGIQTLDELYRTRQEPSFIIGDETILASDMGHATVVRDRLATELSDLQVEYKTHLEHLASINEIISETNNVNVEAKPSIEAELVTINSELNTIASILPADYSHLNATRILTAIDREMSTVLDVSATLPADPDNQYTPERLAFVKGKLDALQNGITLNTATINKVTAIIESHQHADSVDCPVCQHNWIPGWTPENQAQHESTLKRLEAEVIAGELAKKEWLEELDRLANYRDIKLELGRMLSRTPELDHWYNTCVSAAMLRTNPRELNHSLTTYADHMRLVSKQRNLISRKEDLELSLHSIEKALGNQASAIYSKRDTLATSVECLLTEISYRQKTLTDYSRWVAVWNEWFTKAQEITRLLSLLNQYWESRSASIANDYICGCIRTVETELSTVVTAVNQQRSAQGLLQELDLTLASEQSDLAAQRLVEGLLSPVNGIIAEQLSISINAVVSGINAIIGDIWSYPIEIQPCGITEGDLDYLFPVLINDDFTIEDVRSGSEAQRDVVDFAFVQLVYQLLNLTDYPLYLDEIGASFDEVHRGNLLRYINAGIESSAMHQVFMVSHYIAQYSGFGTAEFLVLNDSNITVPEVYNKHVEIT